jgi:serine/threonine-protein kinase RsbT
VQAETRVGIDHEADIVAARQKGRELATQAGFPASDATLIATAISEVARNIVVYAQRGEVLLDLVREGTRRGIRIVARDHGPGIPDVELALQDGYSTGRSLGLGLPGARRIVDEFEIRSEVGHGTTVTMRKWLP